MKISPGFTCFNCGCRIRTTIEELVSGVKKACPSCSSISCVNIALKKEQRDQLLESAKLAYLNRKS